MSEDSDSAILFNVIKWNPKPDYDYRYATKEGDSGWIGPEKNFNSLEELAENLVLKIGYPEKPYEIISNPSIPEDEDSSSYERANVRNLDKEQELTLKRILVVKLQKRKNDYLTYMDKNR